MGVKYRQFSTPFDSDNIILRTRQLIIFNLHFYYYLIYMARCVTKTKKKKTRLVRRTRIEPWTPPKMTAIVMCTGGHASYRLRQLFFDKNPNCEWQTLWDGDKNQRFTWKLSTMPLPLVVESHTPIYMYSFYMVFSVPCQKWYLSFPFVLVSVFA